MKKRIGKYIYLAGSNFAGGTLWEGPGHLLYLERKGPFGGFYERIRRIDYDKIECVSHVRTVRRRLLMALPVVALVLLGAYYFHSLRKNIEFPVPLQVVTWGMLSILLIEVLRGPTVSCTLHTKVQDLRLKPLRRLKEMLRFTSRITELCVEHQGRTPLAPGEVRLLPTTEKRPGRESFREPVSGVRFIQAGLLFLGISGLLKLGGTLWWGRVLLAGLCVAEVLSAVLLSVAVVRNLRTVISPLLNRMIRVGAAIVVLTCAAGYVANEVVDMRASKDVVGAFKRLSSMSPKEQPELRWCLGVLGAGCLLIALFGIPEAMLLKITLREVVKPPPLPSRSESVEETV